MTGVNQRTLVNGHMPVNGYPADPVTPAISRHAEQLYDALAPFARYDGPDTNWALMVWCEALVGGGRLNDLARIGYDQDDGAPGFASLLDVDNCPDWALPWLAQMRGVRVLPGVPEGRKRLAIKAAPGWGRGTPAAIISAAQAYMRAGSNITLVERDTSPYHATLNLYSAQTVGMTYADLHRQDPTIAAFRARYAHYSDIPGTAALNAAVQATKPAGVQLRVRFLDASTYADLQRAFPTIQELQLNLPTYAAARAFIPTS